MLIRAWFYSIAALLSFAAATSAQTPSPLYAATRNGVYRSVDGAKSWQAVSEGLGRREVFSLAVDPSDAATLFAGVIDGVFFSHDSGASWSADNAPRSRVRD